MLGSCWRRWRRVDNLCYSLETSSIPTLEIMTPESLSDLKLWPHQKEAVKTVEGYLQAFKERNTQKAALVHMPTGTGKSAVIASVARFLSPRRCVLVLCPRAALRRQLFREISGGDFWQRVGVSDPSNLPMSVIELKEASKLPSSLNSLVVVTTIQLLHSLAKSPTESNRLKQAASLVLFDEGHYEPATKWRETVRSLETPRVVFTATPFRDDLKFFDIERKHIYSYTYAEALGEQYVRKVVFSLTKPKKNPKDFVETLLNEYENLFGEPITSCDRRVIVHCRSSEAILKVVGALKRHPSKPSFVAIHHTFGDPSKHLYKHVPPKDTPGQIWVHQMKLLEGIDDEKFQMLGIYDSFSSVRSLVQQVGRLIRNPLRSSEQKAYVVDMSMVGSQEDLWKNFIQHDTEVRKSGLDVQGKLLEEIRRAHPEIVYLDRRFRSRLLDLSDLDPAKDILLPKSVIIHYAADIFDARRISDELVYRYEDHGWVLSVRERTKKQCVILYLKLGNSPLLRSHAFLEAKLGITVVRESGPYVCFFDSQGQKPHNLPHVGRQVEAAKLRRLFNNSESRLYTVSLKNSNPSERALRAKTLTAARLRHTIPRLDDYSYICRRVEGAFERRTSEGSILVHRYVGFGNGRVTDGSYRYVTFSEFLSWLEELAEVLDNSTIQELQTFDRYAVEADALSDSQAQAQSILLDLDALRGRFVTAEQDRNSSSPPPGLDLDITDACRVVSTSPQGRSEFTVHANGVECTVVVKYDHLTTRYRLESSELNRLYTSMEDSLDMISFLNAEQAFRIIPKEKGLIYTQKSFFRPRIGVGSEFRKEQTQILSIFRPFQVFAEVTSEKGIASVQPNHTGWEKNCIFDLIDSQGHFQGRKTGFEEYFEGTKLIVCDDMSTELADFILVQDLPGQRKRVVFIHAKAKKSGEESAVSASGIADVCAQATKNLRELKTFSESVTNRSSKWKTPWKSTLAKKPVQVSKRVRTQSVNPSAAWCLVRQYVEDPTVEREVWLVLGRLLEFQAFKKKISRKSKKPPMNAVHVLYTLFATFTAVDSAGARLLVFCSP